MSKDTLEDPVDEMTVGKLEAFADASRRDYEDALQRYGDRDLAVPDLEAVLKPYRERWAADAAKAQIARARFEKQRREREDAKMDELISANVTMAQASADAARSAKLAAIFTALIAAATLVTTIVQLARLPQSEGRAASTGLRPVDGGSP